MGKETREMLKIVLIFDNLILFFTIVTSLIFLKNYMLIIIVGMIMAILNFVLNAIITNYTFVMTGKKIFYLLGSVVRIIITVSVALLLCKSNLYNFIVFLIGYSLHYIAVVLYGITRKNKKGCD